MNFIETVFKYFTLGIVCYCNELQMFPISNGSSANFDGQNWSSFKRKSKLKLKIFTIILAIAFTTNAFAQRTLSVVSSDPRLKIALDLMERRNFQAASLEFQTFLRSNQDYTPGTKEMANYYLAHCALKLDHPDAEEQLLTHIKNFPGGMYETRSNFDLGAYYFQIRKWETAVLYFTKIPADGLEENFQMEADYKTGVACFQLQQFDRAKSYFQKIKNKNHPFKGSAAYYTAYLNYKDGQYDDALSDLDLAATTQEYKPLIPVLKASILYKKKSYDEVISLGNQTFKDTARVSNPEELHLLVGESYFNKKDYKLAAEHFDKYSRAAKGNLGKPLQFRIAFTYFKTDQTDKAIAGFRQVAARLDTSKGKKDTLGQFSSYYLGVCYLKKDQKQFAQNAFDQASLLNADSKIQEVSWFNAGKLAYDLEKYGDAVEILKDFLENYPKGEHAAEANELIGEGLLNSNDFEAALAYMEKTKIKSERLNLAYQRAAYQRGTNYFNDGNNTKATELFTQSLKYPNDKETLAATHFWLGESLMKDRLFAKAMQEYAAVLKIETSISGPYYSKAKFGLGYALFNLKDYSKALGNFKDYISETEKAPQKLNLADAVLRYADCLYATKDYSAALKSYDKAIDTKTSDMDYAFYQKGVVYAVLKDFENARTNFSVVVEKYSKSRLYDEALFQKAQMDFESTNYQAAIRGYSNIIQTMPESSILPFCYLNRGISKSNLKEYASAVEDFKKILDDYPNHNSANSAILGLQEALVQTGGEEQLTEYFAKYKKANPESDALESIEFETCKALYNNQKYTKAIAGFQEYIKNYISSFFIPEAKFYLAESQYRGGSKAEALSGYKEIVSQGKNNWYIRSSFRIAELEYNNGNFNSSAQQYAVLLNGVAKSNKDVNNATLGLIENLYQLGRYDSVASLSAELLKKENLALDVSNKASLYAAKVFVGKGEYEKAIDELLNTVNNAQDVNGAEAQYLVGEVFYKQKKYNESLAALFDLKSRFASYPKWYNKGFLLMADNYKEQKEFFQAQATLNSIIENAKDKETISGAKSRLAAIKIELGADQKP